MGMALGMGIIRLTTMMHTLITINRTTMMEKTIIITITIMIKTIIIVIEIIIIIIITIMIMIISIMIIIIIIIIMTTVTVTMIIGAPATIMVEEEMITPEEEILVVDGMQIDINNLFHNYINNLFILSK